MPPYDWLLRAEMDLSNVGTKLARLQTLGTPYTDEDVANAETAARQQAAAIAASIEQGGGPSGLADKEVVALISFLQRLGKDIRAAGITAEVTQ